ncbi:MAG: hypothetical protein ACOC1P_00100 [Minisyncoccales bacterium]
MAFVRFKIIKGKKYAYLVENEWVNKKVKQKVKQYLGSIFPLPKPLKPLQKLDYSSPKTVLFELLQRELLCRGATQKEEKFFFEDVCIDTKKFLITRKEKSVVLKISNNYLYDSLLKDLLLFYEPETSTDVPGKKLAALISKSGLSISPSEFIEVYSTLYLHR